MIAFTLTILQNYGDKSFLVEYKPADESLTTHTNRIYLDIDATVTKEQVVEKLKAVSPQSVWETELALASVDLSHLNDFEPVEVTQLPQNQEVDKPTEDFVITPEMQQNFKEVEMEAAIQRALLKVIGERV